MRSSSLVWWSLSACAPGEPAPTEPAPFDCTLGVRGDEGFSPLGEGDPAELVLGFQGFVYVELALLAPDAPDLVDTATSFDVDGGETISGAQPSVRFGGEGDDRVSDDILFFLTSGTLDGWEGTPGELGVRAESADMACVTSARVVLADAKEGVP